MTEPPIEPLIETGVEPEIWPRPVDVRLLGLEISSTDPAAAGFVLEPRLCRGDGGLFGGTALAATVALFELASARPALWATVQFIGVAVQGERIECRVTPVARGTYVDQLQLTAVVGERVIFSAVGSTAIRRPDGVGGSGRVMPDVAAPADSELIRLGRAGGEGTTTGHYLVSEFREVEPIPDAPPGQILMWARITDEPALSPATLGFLADMVPVAVCRAAGIDGAGTSLDNSLRIGHVVDTEWVLVELEAHGSSGGYGYGVSHMWAPDGTLMATGSQTAKLFSFEAFQRRLMGERSTG